MATEPQEWNLSNLPPEGHKDVGLFAWGLFEASRDEKDRLQLPETWRVNYKLFRGNHWGSRKKKNTLTVNMFFGNIQRTVANVTSRNPKAEAVDLDGKDDGMDKMATARLKKWWQETNQRAKLRTTTQKSEKYGITIEKAVWDDTLRTPNITVKDPFAVFPSPGFFEDIGADCPYICDAYPEPIEGVEALWNVKDVKASDVYSILGEDREELRPITAGTVFGATSHSSNTTAGQVFPSANSTNYRERRALVVEVWVRDNSKDKDGIPEYPGGIRLITITNEGGLVLDDRKNPNINWELDAAVWEKSFLFKRLPFYKVNSYEDTTSIWGFSAADQVAELQITVDELVSRLNNAVKRELSGGILVIPPNSGITRNMINNKPGLVLFPKTDAAAKGLRFLSPPSVSADLFRAIDLLINLHDRIYSIEDADRGQTPNGVIAASAIVALQERNAVLIQHKINAIDYLVEQRGMCAISMWQNHGHSMETIEVEDGKTEEFVGTRLAGRSFNYVVEAGSTGVKTSLQEQEQASALFKLGAIDQHALLKSLNFPGWRGVVERMAENRLGQAIQIMIEAGLPEETAQQLMQVLQEPQGGPGNEEQTPVDPQAGVPVSQQGQVATV